MATNAPLHYQIESMLYEMKKVTTKNECHKIYLNYLNLYRNEYAGAYNKLTYGYTLHIQSK